VVRVRRAAQYVMPSVIATITMKNAIADAVGVPSVVCMALLLA
jgi:hypothetical protein